MHLNKISPLLATIALAAALAGCGSSGSSGVSAKAYVKSICGAVAPFEKDVLTRSSALNLTQVKSPTQGKQALQSFLRAISGDTDTAVSKLQSAGSPNVKNGKQISSAIVSAFTQLKSAMHQAVTQADQLPTGSATAFKNGAVALGTNVRNSMTGIGQHLQASTIKSPELQTAAKNEPSCQQIGGA